MLVYLYVIKYILYIYWSKNRNYKLRINNEIETFLKKKQSE